MEQQLGAAAALAGLPSVGPRRLTALLAGRAPAEAWVLATSGRRSLLQEVLGGEAGLTALTEAWSAAGRGIDLTAVLAAHAAAGVAVRVHPGARGSQEDEADPAWPSYPEALVDDLEPPAVLLTQGPLEHLEGPRVAIVGTRRCTGVGAGVARELGRELSAAGVHVVSGLALGIDGAAHRGVLDAMSAHDDAAPPIGVVGSGHDVVYPTRHRELWRTVADRGLLVSEAPLGTRPTGWRFPARNRVIAALADVVVVVESHAAGGSLHTVQEAIHRDIDVMAVPGSVRSAAAAGSNQLLAEGCHPVRDAGDVLVALGLQRARRRRVVEHRDAPSTVGTSVLEAFDWEPATLEHLAVRTGLALPELAVALEGLVAAGWVGVDGGWYERRAAS
ncbi:MAG TPA: DNA-processing protein DprA [Acidimicrobiales bacterium]|nr:DNA-processing protein DprA [Acidimicrobiales bacterium]